LYANLANKLEGPYTENPTFTSTGFTLSESSLSLNNNGSKYVFVAIAAPVVRSLTQAEFAEQKLKFTTYENRKDVKCGEMAEEQRDAVITSLAEAGYDLPDILRYM